MDTLLSPAEVNTKSSELFDRVDSHDPGVVGENAELSAHIERASNLAIFGRDIVGPLG